MKVFARLELSRGRLPPASSALLLEGEWPGREASAGQFDGSQPGGRWSLDRAIDSRHRWIDEQAADLAEHFACQTSDNLPAGFAWLNVVRLRYLLVKLLRVTAFFRAPRRSALPEVCELFCQPGRDACYAQLMRALAEHHGFELVVHAVGSAASDGRRPAGDRSWRRVAERFARHFQPPVTTSKPRVLLCGNPRLLAPVCQELLRRELQPWWLAERFAPRSWCRWRLRGAGLLACDGPSNAADARSPAFALTRPDEPSSSIESAADRLSPAFFAPVVEAWLRELSAQLGPPQARHAAHIAQHFDRLDPLHVVLDQDGSPFNRAVVAAARERGVPSSIVQHGAPFIRFGFAPLVADRFCAWGETSRAQLERWGVERGRIGITGAAVNLPTANLPTVNWPTVNWPAARDGRSRVAAPRFALLATLAPSDSRPDAASYHLTGGTFASMIRSALTAASHWPRASLVIKLHPRDPRSPEIRKIAGEFAHVKTRIVARGSLASVLHRADCVLSCASSAGIEAAAAGWPVIQLMPEGSCELLDARAWGLAGTARSSAELEALIAAVLAEPCDRTEADPSHRTRGSAVIAASGQAAAIRIVDSLLMLPAAHDSEPQPGDACKTFLCVKAV